MFRTTLVLLVLAKLLFSCASSPDDKWYTASASISTSSDPMEAKADSLAREVCACMSGIMATELGEAEFESILDDHEQMVAMTDAEREVQKAKIEEKYASMSATIEALERKNLEETSPCMTALNAHMGSLAESSDGKLLARATADRMRTNCRVVRLVLALKGKGSD